MRNIYILLLLSLSYSATLLVPSEYSTIQSAINASSEGDTVLVSDGTYNISQLDILKGIVMKSENGNAANCILNGNSSGVSIIIENTTNSFAIIDGFTLQNSSNGYSGTIWVKSGLAKFQNCIFQNNSAGNTAFNGSGIDQTYFINCIARNNNAENNPGFARATLIGCLIHNNYGWNNGTVSHECKLINCTVTENTGGCVYPTVCSSDVQNSIIWNNGCSTELSSAHGETAYATFSNIDGGFSGEGNINTDPIFGDGYTLQENSPCIDAGSPDSEYNDPDGTRNDMGAYYFHQEQDVYGCTDPNATNFDETANVDDGSCEYETVQIGHQVWMSENLKATHYNNGDAIPTGLDNVTWSSTNEGAYAVYDDDPTNAEIYGNLYNYYAVDDSRGICMEGWHVPSDDEWTVLTNYLGGSSIAGGKMKEEGHEHWVYYSEGISEQTTNVSGLTALPSGRRHQDGSYDGVNTNAYFFVTNNDPYERVLYHSSSQILRAIPSPNSHRWGFSIRCLSDETLTTTILVPENFATIQEAIDYSIDGDTILVSAGTYYENINFNGKNISLIGEDRETTIIDGGQNGSVVTFNNGEDIDAQLSHFTITNGKSGDGAGIYCSFSSPTIVGCKINNNEAVDGSADGGGIVLDSSNALILDCIIENNLSGANGGGIGIYNGSSIIINNSTIQNNSAISGGGIDVQDNSIITVTSSIISNNQATNDNGGGIRLTGNANASISNTIISNNGANNQGGGIFGSFTSLSQSLMFDNSATHGGAIYFTSALPYPNISNSTIINNFSTHGGGIYCDGAPTIVNSILWNNNNEQITISGADLAGAEISYSDVDGGLVDGVGGSNENEVVWDVESNIDADPLFCDTDNGDFTVRSDSPVLGTGQYEADMGAFGVGCEPIFGCTHPNATNYYETANVDDGSCEYETVQIGHQVWMSENLKATHYNNGDAIPTGLDNDEWSSTTEGAYAVYDDDPANAEIYGNLYNWYTVDDNRGVCPEDFHIPSDDEYTGLTDYLGSANIAGGKMKEAGTAHWNSPNTGATNESGFTGLPAGLRYYNPGNYYYIGTYGYFWSSSEASSSNAWSRGLNHNLSSVYRGSDYNKHYGVSIRCLSDETQTTTILVPENFATIQQAINYSIDGDTVLVSAGTYYENINFNGKNIALIGADRETTIIDGGQNGSVVVFEGTEESAAVLSGFTLTNGTTSGNGGGIDGGGAQPTIYDCIIKNNTADKGGAISSNGGISLHGLKIYNNSSQYEGNAIYFNGSNDTSIVVQCIIYNNTDASDAYPSQAIALESGSKVMITNSDIINNVSVGIKMQHSNDYLSLINTIIYGNAESLIQYNGVLESNYSLIQGGWEGEGNIDADPFFIDPYNGDFTLQPSSPCIDAGDPESELDPDGTIADMGAYPTYQGCIDPDACNYNPLATVDDDSCLELDPCGVCGGEAECLVLDSDLFGTWQNESNIYYSNSDCSGEGEVMGSDFDDVPDQIEINSDGTMVQMELFEDNICSDVSDCPEMEYMTCLEDGYCASVVYSQWGVNEDTSECWIIYESQYASFSYSLDSNGNLIANSDGNSDGIECANNDIECCWNFIFNPIIDYTLDLDAGANLKSFYALPEDVSVSSIMSSLGDDVTGVITEGGACSQITPGNWVGSQCNLLPEKGYWIIVTTDDDLPVFDAVPTDPTLEYTLHAGANLISFPSADTVAVPDALPDDIELAVSGVITEGGACSQITQGTWVGSQCSFIGGKGYWMIISTGISFSYDFITLGRTNIAYKQEKLSGYEYTQSSKQAFYFIESIENIEIGDWILTYNGDKLIGSKQWQGSIIDVPAMGNDGNDYSDGYLEAGATPQFKLLSGGKLIDLEGEISTWSDNGLFMVSSLTQVIVPEVYSLSQAYPNPFNPVTTLSFAIPVDSEVSLSIYNLQGREVSTLIEGNIEAGYHSVVWDANSYSSGVYFVKMVAGEFVNTQKLMLIK